METAGHESISAARVGRLDPRRSHRVFRSHRSGGHRRDLHPLNARTKKSATTREQLIDATERLMCASGLSDLTTQKVARECGVAEGTIYRHFGSREELISSTLRERLPGEFRPHIDALVARAGLGTIEDNLRTFTLAIVPIFSTIAPTLGMLAADPALAARNAAALRIDGAGPGNTVDRIGEYFRAEQGIGRVPLDVDVRTAAGLIVAFCFYRSLMTHLFNEDPTYLSDDELSRTVAAIVGRGVRAEAP